MKLLFTYRFAVVVLSLCCAFSATPLLADDSEPPVSTKPVITIKSEVDKNQITIGDVFRYSMIIQYDPNISINLPGWGINVGHFEIRDYHTEETKNPDGTLTSRSDYFLSIYDTGTYQVPAIMLPYQLPGSEETKTIVSDMVEIEVISVASSEPTDVKGLKNQAVIPPDYTMLYLVGSISLFVLLLGAGLIYYFKKIRQKTESDEPVYRGPPHEIALQELEALLAADLVKQGRIKEFYFELSEVIRRYLGARFQIYTLERTTEEIKSQVHDLFLDTEVLGKINEFLDNTDLVKFAKYVPEKREIDVDINLARLIIDKTKIETFTRNDTLLSEDTDEPGMSEPRDQHASEEAPLVDKDTDETTQDSSDHLDDTEDEISNEMPSENSDSKYMPDSQAISKEEKE